MNGDRLADQVLEGAESWRVGVPTRIIRQRRAAEQAMRQAGWPPGTPLILSMVGRSPSGRAVWEAQVK